MSFKKNVVGGLKFWKYFRTSFAGTHPPRLLVSRQPPWLQRHKILVILMGHQKMPKIWDVLKPEIRKKLTEASNRKNLLVSRDGGFNQAGK